MNYTVQMIVETPMGSTQKFDRDLKTGLFELTKIMPKGMAFPYDFGYIPSTLGEDGDPLDVVCISELPTFTGCQLNCRIIGAIQVLQTERDGTQMRNDRYIAVPEISETYANITKVSELPKGILHQLESFFISYNTLAGKKLKILKHATAKQAVKLIEQSIKKEKLPNFRIEILLPTTASNGKPFPKGHYTKLKIQLIDKFGGLTAYTRSPIEGHWKDGKQIISQTLNVYEVLAIELDENYWRMLKQKLEKKFRQQEILIIHSLAAKV